MILNTTFFFLFISQGFLQSQVGIYQPMVEDVTLFTGEVDSIITPTHPPLCSI